MLNELIQLLERKIRFQMKWRDFLLFGFSQKNNQMLNICRVRSNSSLKSGKGQITGKEVEREP